MMKSLLVSRAALSRAGIVLGLAAALCSAAHAQVVISDNLSGAKSTYQWRALGGACLTAGTAAAVINPLTGGPALDSAGNAVSSIPGCTYLRDTAGQAYYGKTLIGGTVANTFPDAAGTGALRLTNGDTTTNGTNGTNANGAVVSDFTFPSNSGIQVTFKTVTYGGNGYNNASGVASGADGISFFLADGSQPASVGGLGGSLGYSCSNGNSTYDGVVGGYIGIGIDEYGNFSNAGDNTNTGYSALPNQIAMRGAGNTNWATLHAAYPSYYPTGLAKQAEAVKNTCKTGTIWNYSSGNGVNTGTKLPATLSLNYPILTTKDTSKVTSATLFNQEAIAKPTRGAATAITYTLNLTQAGILDFSYSVGGASPVAVIQKQDISASNGTMPSSFRFGFSAGTGGGSNIHEITCFKAAPSNLANSSSNTNVQQSAKVQQGSQVYLAYYHPVNSWGQLTATTLATDATGVVSLNTYSQWDASCVLTGGACPATNGTTTAQASRNMLTWNGSTGVPFQWGNLTSTQQTSLGSTALLSYLRGIRTGEAASGGAFRTRTGVLGDIIDSGPTWVGAPALPYDISWADKSYPSASPNETSGSYANYKTSNATRTNVVYVGANDGFLHGFRAGNYDASGNFLSTSPTNDGAELLAYMPGAILTTMHSSSTVALDYSAIGYSHNYYVDATPGTGDLYYGNAWHTWVVGGAGYGGNATGAVGDTTTTANGVMFALDVTNPSNFSETNASSLVLGEWTSASLTCDSDAGGATCGQNLGSTVGTPIIRRLHNGNWAVLFGNGLNSATGTAGLYIMNVASDGTRSFRFIDTGYGPTRDPLGNSNKNGIAYVSSADLDGDHITDYVYAGDAFGNVWRFDLTGNTAASWSAATPFLMFSTPAGQPITTQVAVASVPAATTGGLPRIVVGFGTGRQIPQTLTSAATYASGAQWLYGVWDWNLSTWSSSAAASARYASLTAAQTLAAAGVATPTASNLVTQVITALANSGTTAVSGGYRTITNNQVCWAGTTVCTTANSNVQFGWKAQLPTSTEQVIYSPTISNGDFVVNTTVPAVSQALSCDPQPASGFTMAVTMGGGGAGTASFFADANNKYTSLVFNGSIVAGLGLSATGSPSIVSSNQRQFLVQQTAGGAGSVTAVNTAGNGQGTRLNWKQLR